VLLSPVSSSSSSPLLSTTAAAGEGTTTPLFFHFDSVTGSSNQKAAHAVATKLNQALEMKRAQKHAHADPSIQRDLEQTPIQAHAQRQIQLHQCASPQQRNGYDCGMHVLANAQVLVDCTETELIGIGNTNVTGLTDILQQRVTSRSLSFAERLRAEIAQDIRLRAASAL
jgi:sulfur relay (sulfurtransferase) complex TusBCD TusD component (DsrE family)